MNASTDIHIGMKIKDHLVNMEYEVFDIKQGMVYFKDEDSNVKTAQEACVRLCLREAKIPFDLALVPDDGPLRCTPGLPRYEILED